jgi:hypothetical protein
MTLMLRGWLFEYTGKLPNGEPDPLAQGCIRFRGAKRPHRLEVPLQSNTPVTLFITGPKFREWGFWCPQGWRHNHEYIKPEDHGKVGRGCD